MRTDPKHIIYTDESKSRDTPTFVLYKDVTFYTDILTVTVPAGFSTDFGSVPKYARWLVSGIGLYDPAYVLHDYLYTTGNIVSRYEADKLLRRYIIDLGGPKWEANVVFAACRLGGSSHWAEYTTIPRK